MSATAFSSNDDVIERRVNCKGEATQEADLNQVYEFARCISWINNGNYRKVALQFPDHLLVDAPRVVNRLQSAVSEAFVFILGDTSYGSCCVDEVGAEHYQADCVIHFGHACLSPTARLPVLYVFGRSPLDVEDCVCQLGNQLSGEQRDARAVLVYDTCFLYIIDELFPKVKALLPNIILSQLRLPSDVPCQSSFESSCSEMSSESAESKVCKCGRIFTLPKDSSIEDYTFVFVGDTTGPSLINLMMSFNKCSFYTYNPKTFSCVRESVNINRALMKRFYLIERVKDANIVGIVAGTLGVSRYREMIEHLKKLLKMSGKKSYTFVVGKLNPAKLANFAEIELFVLVSCPESCLMEQSEFYQPVVSPLEVEVALNQAHSWTGQYSMDFRDLLPGGSLYVPVPDSRQPSEYADVSLINNKARVLGVKQSTEDSSTAGGEVVLKSLEAMTVATKAENAAEFLTTRSFQGLEQNLGKDPVVKASEGARGIAGSYDHEPDHQS